MPFKTVAVANQKGGVGKTTTAIHLGSGLAMEGYRTLLIDIDPQANATTGLGFSAVGGGPGIYDVLINESPAENVIQQTKVGGLDLMPADERLHGAEIELVPRLAREKILAEALNRLDENYDFILMDCPPSLGLLTLNSLTASTSVIIPMQCEYYALEGLARLMKTVRLVQRVLNPPLKIEGIVLTMYDGRLNLSRQVRDEIAQVFGSRVYRTMIARNVRLSEAPSFGKPIYEYDPSSKGARNYHELTIEFITAQGLRAREAVA